jgi:S1-C subfamily serine protease
MEKIVISDAEVQSVQVAISGDETTKLVRAIPLWARIALAPLTLFLPLLCLVALVLRIALRAAIPRTRQAWSSYLNTLLIAGGFLTSIAAVVFFSMSPVPPQSISAGLVDFDERTTFPVLPAEQEMTGAQVASRMRPLVTVASPVRRTWLQKTDAPSGAIGAALLLYADHDGYLFATAKHVAEGTGLYGKATDRVLLSSSEGGWAASDVVGRDRNSDVALLWVSRHSGDAQFAQPVATDDELQPGEQVFVIGHPEGLNFSLSNGIISRMQGDVVQISAPVSPGNSGGPVYDARGELLGVVSSKLDRTYSPNAENLSFAVSAHRLTTVDGWDFRAKGRDKLSRYIEKLKADASAQTTQEEHGKH